MGTGINTGTNKVLFYTSFTLFPTIGTYGFIYIDSAANIAYLWDATALTYVQANRGPDIPDDPTPLAFVNAATANILSFSPVYYNGVANDGVGATLIASVFGKLTDGSASGFIDHTYAAIVGDFILVKNQSAQQNNGLYEIISIGSASTYYSLQRIVDYDNSAALYPLQISVLLGQDNALKYFTQTTVNPVIGNAVTGKLVFLGSSLQAPPAQIAFVDTVTSAALPTCVYTSGTSVGVPGLNAKLTGSVNGALPAINGLTPSISALSGANKILVKNQADPSKNGDYVVVNAGSATTKWILKRINFTAASFDRYTRMYVVSNVNSTAAGIIYYPSINNTRTNLTIGTPTTGNISFIPASLNLGYTPEDQANKSTNTSLGTSNTLYPTQNAVKVYTDSILGNANALVYKGVVDCSINPNYPAGNAGELYIVSVAGKIGGASGTDVEVGDMVICNTDGTVSGDQATVGVYWNIIQKNISGAVSGPASSANNNVAFFDGVTGKLIKDSGVALSGTNTGNQVITHTSDATSHLVTVSASGGFLRLSEGSGISLTTTGTLNNGIVTIAATNSGTVTSVTGTTPIVSSGGATPAISIPQATTSVDGYLSAANWTTFDGKQAALTSGTNIKTVNGSSILGSGNLIANNTYMGNTLSMTYGTPDTIGNFALNYYVAASVTIFTVYSGDTDYYNPWLSKIEGNSSYVLQIGSLQGIYGLYLVTSKTFDAGNAWYYYTLTLIKASGTFVFGDAYSVSFTKVSLGLTLTTSGTSGPATISGDTLNIPQYTGSGSDLFALKPNHTFRGAVLNNNTATVGVEGGVTLSTSASVQARAVINTNFASKQIGARYYASVVSTGRYSGTRGATQSWFINGGFLYTCDFNISDTAYSATCQQFYGMQGSIVDLNYGGASSIAVNTLINCIGVGSDAADTNLQIFHNDATGTCTKVDLGISFPANRPAGAILTTVYSVLIYNPPGTNDVHVKVTNAETGISVENTLSTNLPLSTLGLNFFASRAQGTGGGVTNSGQFDLMKLGVYSIL